jgi:cytochrome c oxidase accessory protein FixG
MEEGAQHTSWVIVSLLTALSFVGYFVPIDELFVNFFTFESSGAVVAWTLFFAGCTYANSGWMREVMCLHICPYARFQSSMFDKDTFTVTYDAERGENRGPRSRKVEPKEVGLGDCVDCNLCVLVCPTGIDIRNGLQYECINCGACIDACNETMDKMNYERGLISYTTEHSLEGKKTHVVRPKLFGYLAVILIMTVAFIWQITSRLPLELNIDRDRTALFRENSEGLIENTYTLLILNKSQHENTYVVNVEGLKSFEYFGEKEVNILAGEAFTLPISLAVDPYDLSKPVTNITITVTSKDGDVKVYEESRFFKGR